MCVVWKKGVRIVDGMRLVGTECRPYLLPFLIS